MVSQAPLPTVGQAREGNEPGRDRILAAAARLFRRHGYAAVSLRSIAAEAGMQGGSLYHHFRGKEDIVGAVLDLGIQRVHRAVETALETMAPTAGPRETIQAAVTAHLQALLTHSDYTSANVRIFGQVPPQVREGNRAVRRAYESLWTGLLERAANAGLLRDVVEPWLARRALIGALNATLEWFDPETMDPAELARAYSALFLDGLLRVPAK